MSLSATPFSKKMKCPIENDCGWLGFISQMPSHCQSAHPQKYLENIEVKMDAKDKSTKIFLHMKNEVIYVLELSLKKGNLFVKFNLMHRKMWSDNNCYIITLLTSSEGRKFKQINGNLEKKPEVKLHIADRPLFTAKIKMMVKQPLLMYYESTRNRSKCQICEILMAPPVNTCRSGHISCSDCVGFNKFCKGCNAVSPMENLEMISDGVLMLQETCKFKRDGCLFSGCILDVRLHEADCRYRIIPCALCMGLNFIYDFEMHFKIKHPEIKFYNLDKVELKENDFKFQTVIFMYGIFLLVDFERKGRQGRIFHIMLTALPIVTEFYQIVVRRTDNSLPIRSVATTKNFESLKYDYKINRDVKSITVHLDKLN